MLLSDEHLRGILDPVPASWPPRPGLRPAAVLAPLFCRDGRDWLLFTLRRKDLPHHAGQVSFPGGARELDEDPLACALRETEEETGVPAAAVAVLGSLPPRVSIAGYWVHLLVGRIAAPTALRPDPLEVERTLEIPVAELMQPPRWELRPPPAPHHVRPPSPHFDCGGAMLWGLTARFTLELLDRVRRAGSPGVPPEIGTPRS